jgi:predicted Rossmann fold flavoprotein
VGIYFDIDEKRSIHMEKGRKVLVIGGGAAGLVAAISAARNGAEVKILERMNRVGKKILATGNGRCNLTNAYARVERYHGNNPNFIEESFKQFTVEMTMDFFEELGIACKEERDGKVYPASDQASSVLDVLRYELEELGIEEACEHEVTKIQRNGKGFTLHLKNGEKLQGDRVILTPGGKAAPSLGSNGSGYKLAQDLGHKLVEPFPALVQLRLESQHLKAINGVKFMGRATIGVENEEVRIEDGELLYTAYGISGPPIFQLSRAAAEKLHEGKRPWVRVDMFPEFSEKEVYDSIRERLSFRPQKPLDFSFVGLLNKRLIPAILKEAGFESIHRPAGEVSTREIKRIVELLKGWTFEITGTQSWTEAQVTAGGIDVKDVNPSTLESKLVPGLYLAGEILDIDGDCGGYNLQWAWSSGYLAGYYAALSLWE